MAASSSATVGSITGSGPVGMAKGGEGARIAVDNLAFSGRLLDLDQLVAGGKDSDLRSAIDRDEALLHGGEHGQFAGAALGASLDNRLAATHVLAAPANVCAALFNGEDLDLLLGGASVLYWGDGIGSGRHGRARHNAAGLAGADRFLRHLAGRYVFDDFQGYGRVVFRGGYVRMAHGIAVHGRVVAGRIVAGAPTRLGPVRGRWRRAERRARGRGLVRG